MREIKFRGKRWDYGEWVYGLPVNYCNKTYILVLTDFEEERVYEQYPHKEMWPYEVIPETVGQYTGLKDKNGKEIYEGSIVRFYPYGSERIGLVEFLNGGWKFGGFDLMYFGSERIEVIGNIYENPELLEGANDK